MARIRIPAPLAALALLPLLRPAAGGEAPPAPARWTLSTADTTLVLGVGADLQPCIVELRGPAGWNWTAAPSPLPMPDRAEMEGEPRLLRWAFQKGTVDAADGTKVTLTTTPLAGEGSYTLTVGGIADASPRANPVAPGARATFRHSPLLAHWRLDDGPGDCAMDASGNGHHGFLRGARGGPAWTEGPRGTVLAFDGVEDCVEADNGLPELAMPFTIALWVRPGAAQVRHADILGNHGEPFSRTRTASTPSGSASATASGGRGAAPPS
jgi:hypothetical protein